MARVFGVADQFLWTLEKGRDRHVGVGCHRDKRGVGAIFQQPAHQIRKEIAVAADRRIDAAGHIRELRAQGLVEHVAHAIEPLKLEPATPPATSIALATVSALWVAN